MNNIDFGDFLLTSGLKNHQDHAGHRDKCLSSVNSEVDFPCDEPFLFKLKKISVSK